MAVFLSFLLLALAEGNASWNIGGWSSNFILICFGLAVAGLIIFLVTEMTVEHPFIELRLFKDFNFGVCNLVLFVFGVSMFGSTFLMPLYLQNSLGYTAVQAGMVFLPVGIMQAITSVIAGALSDRIDHKIPIILGVVLLAVSMYMNSFLSLTTEHLQIMVPLYIRGLSLGLLFTPLSTLSLAHIQRDKIAQASGLFNVIRQVGGSFGVAIFGTILTRRALYHAAVYGQSVTQNSPQFKAVAGNLTHFIQQMSGEPLSQAATQASILIGSHIRQQAFVQAVSDNFFVAAAISIAALIPIIFIPSARGGKGHGASIGE
jgi:DHA2 family multidrug resistance protein